MTTLLTSPSAEYEGQSVNLTDDQRAVVLRELKEQVFAFSHLMDLVNKSKTVQKAMAFNVLYINESRTSQLTKIFDIELDSASAQEDRYAAIRRANTRIRELEKELGQSGSVSQTKAHLNSLSDQLELWWDVEGFGYIRNISYTKYGHMEVEFSCRPSAFLGGSYSDKPVTKKLTHDQWLQSLAERGFTLMKSRSDRDTYLKDCDSNRQKVVELFARFFPSARVTEFRSHFDRDGKADLADCKVFFHSLEEVAALPTERTVERE